MSSWTEVEIARHASAWRLLSDVTYQVVVLTEARAAEVLRP